MENSDQSLNYAIPQTGGEKKEITVVVRPDTVPRQVNVWSGLSEDDASFATTSNSETEKKHSDASEGNRDNYFDSTSLNIEKKEDFRNLPISNNNLAQAGNEDGITIQTVSENSPAEIMVTSGGEGENYVVDNSAMSEIDHGQDRTECIMNAATMCNNTVAQEVMDQSDVSTEESSNGLADSHEEDRDTLTALINNNLRGQDVVLNNELRRQDIIVNWYNYVAMVRQSFFIFFRLCVFSVFLSSN